ncbi:glycogen debranching enzyme GlgX, partial [Stenotrophomonas maltophilia]
DVTWLAPDGNEMTTEHWQDAHGRCLGMLLDGRAQETGIRRPGSDATVLLVVNAHHDIVNFRLPQVPAGEFWTCMLDTHQP